MNPVFPLLAALLLMSVHVFSGYLRFLDTLPRNRILSAGAGITVAFVVLQLLPSVAAADQTISGRVGGSALSRVDDHAYAIVLISIVIFFAVEQWARASTKQKSGGGNPGVPPARVFWVHMLTFAVMNFLIGYILIERHDDPRILALFVVAMFVKFLVSDRALHRIHQDGYDNIGRWLLVAAVIAGWITGYFGSLGAIGPAAIQAFIAGGVLLNVFSEELPEERQSRLGAFAAAALVFGALLIFL